MRAFIILIVVLIIIGSLVGVDVLVEMSCAAPLSFVGMRIRMSGHGTCAYLTIGECKSYIGADPVVFVGMLTSVVVDG